MIYTTITKKTCYTKHLFVQTFCSQEGQERKQSDALVSLTLRRMDTPAGEGKLRKLFARLRDGDKDYMIVTRIVTTEGLSLNLKVI